MKKGEFVELQTRLGWNFAPSGLVFNNRWRDIADPTKHCMYDWMHVWFVSGVWNVHVGLMNHICHA